MIHTDSSDPAFRYEGLMRAAFDDCSKLGDPFGYAAQELYNMNCVPDPNTRMKIALSVGIAKIVIDHPESVQIDNLLKLIERIEVARTQEEIIDIIDEGIEILNQIKG